LVVFQKNIVDVRSYKNRFRSWGKEFKFRFKSQYALVSSNESFLELVQLAALHKVFKKVIKKKKKINRKGKYKKKKRTFKLKNVRIEGVIGKIGKWKRRSKYRKIWMFLWPNHILTRKSKNSRMGKGKGAFNRWVLKLRRGTTILESIGLSMSFLTKVVSWFNKQSKLKIHIVSNTKLFKRVRIWNSSQCWYNYISNFRFQ